MEIAIIWIILCIVIGLLGKNKKIGFGAAFLLSLILSPLIGLIIVLVSSSKEPHNKLSSAMVKLINEGDQLFRKKDYDNAIDKYNGALKYSDKAPATNFKLAKSYSMKKNGQESLKHLIIAIEQGYKNFDKIQNDKELSYLRDMSEFKELVVNNYKFENNQSVRINTTDKYDKFEKLNYLLKNGILNQEEFTIEKNKILNENQD